MELGFVCSHGFIAGVKVHTLVSERLTRLPGLLYPVSPLQKSHSHELTLRTSSKRYYDDLWHCVLLYDDVACISH